MKVISNEPNDRVVELSRPEQAARDFFEDCLDHGDPVEKTIDELGRFGRSLRRPYDPAFIDWLRP
jgi:hypothetical protein